MQKEVKQVVITGPESTGKTELTLVMSSLYNTSYVPEYARDYISGLKKPYTYDDIEKIARKQIELSNEKVKIANKVLFYDTYLIITKVWFQWVFNDCPTWLLEEISKLKIDLFLLCDIDIPWIPDPLRENGGENRIKLFNIYINELNNYGFKYKLINGFGEKRYENARLYINQMLNNH